MNKEAILKRLYEAKQITFEELMILTGSQTVIKEYFPITPYSPTMPIVPYYEPYPNPMYPSYWNNKPYTLTITATNDTTNRTY